MSARRLESSFPLIEFTSSTGSQDRLSGEIRGSRLTLKLDALRARSTEDVRRLRAPEGYLRAGAPRYATLFGRDSLISALQMLDIDPTIAAATLRILASFQGRGEDRESEEQPGKILHEHRFDAASRLELPSWKFPYYGSVDSTPLFLIVGDAYLRKTADSQLARELWGAFRSAHEWMARYGDSDHDGYLEYERTNPSGLFHQGWKDGSNDHLRISPPVALVEVQGYAYAAHRAFASLAQAQGDTVDAAAARDAAEHLRERINEDFWLEDQGFFALALDGTKRRDAPRPRTRPTFSFAVWWNPVDSTGWFRGCSPPICGHHSAS